MARERLHEALTTLHEELEAGARVSDEDRDLLRRVADDVDRVLEEEELGHRLKERAEELATEFEADHPRGAHVLGEIVEALGRMGI
jgi:hypothetical protein